MSLKNASSAERKAVFIETSARIGIRPDMVEKDFWVTWVLNQLFGHDRIAKIFLFKGGTSLSKAYNSIKRFSEDIDLLLDLREVSDPGETFEKERSKNAINTFKSKTAKRTAAYIRETLLPEIIPLFAPFCTVNMIPEEPENLYIKFPSVFATSGYIRPDIKLEIGAFAKGTPFAPMKIRSYVSEQFPTLAENSIAIPTVSISRTFWEKITVLHYLYFLPTDRETPLRHSRHFYDIFMLAHSPYKDDIYASAELLKSIIEFDRKFYIKKGVNYDEMNLQTLHLFPAENRIDDLRRDYQQMQEMIFGEKPTWNELLDFIHTLENELHDLSI